MNELMCPFSTNGFVHYLNSPCWEDLLWKKFCMPLTLRPAATWPSKTQLISLYCLRVSYQHHHPRNKRSQLSSYQSAIYAHFNILFFFFLNLNTFVISAFVCVFYSLFIVTHLPSFFVVLAFIFAINAPFCWHQASFKKNFSKFLQSACL